MKYQIYRSSISTENATQDGTDTGEKLQLLHRIAQKLSTIEPGVAFIIADETGLEIATYLNGEYQF